MLVFTIAGWIIAFKIITAPLRGARHIYNVFSTKSETSEKENSKDVIADAGRRVGTYLAFLFAMTLGIGLLGVLSWAKIPAGFTVFATILVGGVLWMLYIELQNRI